MIYNCPRCNAKVPEKAQFCANCGLKRRGTQPIPVTPATANAAPLSRTSEELAPTPANTPERGQKLPAIPKREVQPHVKRVPARPNSGSYNTLPVQPARLAQPAPANSEEQRQGFTPTIERNQNNPSTPLPPTNLIRPVGTWKTQTPSPYIAQSAQADRPQLKNASPLQAAPTNGSDVKSAPSPDSSAIRPGPEIQTHIPETPQRSSYTTLNDVASMVNGGVMRNVGEQRSSYNVPMPVWPEKLPKPQQFQLIESALQQQGRGSPLTNVPNGVFPARVAQVRPPFIEANEHFAQDDTSSESYVATSAAAERWRTSWRDRQRSEAGPAMSASRGQSLVPEPLMAMQSSFVRMRAIIIPKSSHATLRFWLSLILMVCVMGGLAAFIASTFQTAPDSASQGTQQSVAQPPNLSIAGTPMGTIVQGQFLHLHGDNFAAGAPISFLLDGTATIKSADGRPLSVLTSEQGSFDVAIPITATWSAGAHIMQAHDSIHNQNAYLNIDISLAAPTVTTSKEMALSAKQLTFQASVEQGKPKEQFVTLTNTSSAPLLWTARAVVENNLSWLNIDESTNSGHLNINGITSVGINVIVNGLTATAKPYTGKIIFTINANEQLTLPVVLQLVHGTPEISLNPNPLIGMLSPTGGSCQANTTLLVVNLSSEQVSWSISLNGVASTHIAFLQLGKPKLQGSLAPTGQQGDSTMLTLQCVHVKNGDVYHFAFNANAIAWPEVVTIQAVQ